MGSTRKLLYLVVVLIGLVIALPFIVPLNLFVSGDMQKTMSAQLKRRVSIGNIRFAYQPYPTAILENVQIGPGAQDGTIASIELQVDLLTVFSEQKRLRKFSVTEASLTQAFLQEIPSLLKPSAEKKTYITRQIEWHKSSVRTANQTYGPIDAEIALNPDQSFSNVTLHNPQNSVEVQIRPLKDHYAISLSAKNWEAPLADQKVLFESLVIEAETQGMAIMANEIKGDLAHGRFKGSAVLDWSNGWAVTSQFEINNMNGEEVTSLFNAHTNVSGRINGTLDFASASDSFDSLFKRPTVKFQFNLVSGVLNNFNFIDPIRRNVNSSGIRGGSTKYDEMSGVFNYEGNRLSIKDVKIKSGLLNVSGNISATDNKLSGTAVVSLGQGANRRTVPLRIAGEYDNPLLIPPAASTGESSVIVITQ